MPYHVKESYLTLQGEGAQAGQRAVFCRFTGCNLWSGREAERATAKCWFCDTDFVGTDGNGGGVFKTADELASWISKQWTSPSSSRMVVFTGGEPLLQLDEALIDAMHGYDFRVAIETNGTLSAPKGVDWITVSPKPQTDLLQKSGNELKLVYPGVREPKEFEELHFEYFYLSPLWTAIREDLAANIEKTMQYCEAHPRWRLTLQLQKLLGIP